MLITKDDFHRSCMTLREVREIMPFMDYPPVLQMIRNAIRKGLIEVDETLDFSVSPGRGKARKYSVKNCIEMAVFWAMVGGGYKPAAVAKIAALVVSRAETIIDEFQDIDDLIMDERVMLVFYEMPAFEIGPLRSLPATTKAVAEWMTHSDTRGKEAREIAATMRKYTGNDDGNLAGYHVLPADYLIRRVLEGYRDL